MRHPSGLRDVGEIVMVVDNYPGKMKIGGRCGRIVAYDPQALADGTLAEWFKVELFDDTSPHGDRYMNPMRLGNALLEVCNISDSSDHCYEHQRAHKMTNSWETPTPPKFKTVEEADRWLEQQAEKQRVRENIHVLQDEFLGVKAGDMVTWTWGDKPVVVNGDTFTVTQTFTL